ncbi:MAG TPA: M1 family metallopeptidase [Pyrinomonadaceae bacterium]|nr:M1 family metallopeptidase [Pyrinomonadaceae bacterium]
MRNPKTSIFLLCLMVVLTAAITRSQTRGASNALDVLHYDITLEPDITQKTISGKVIIKFVANASDLKTVAFDCGDLTVDAVQQGGQARSFSVSDHRLNVTLPPLKAGRTSELSISYHGAPKRGIRFFPDASQVYTIFSTSQWTICIDAPEDKARLRLTLIVPSNLTALSSGRLVSMRQSGNKIASVWEQNSPIPTYIFGFCVGPFRTVREKHGRTELQYLVTGFSDEETHKIFRDTPDMLEFFESRAGVRYADKTYSQVLAAGGVEQEMSSFTALNEAYGKKVLANEQDLWLGAHEFAHQWWGNMVTCRDWNHFWLNEGIATFMAAAYLEHRFGREAYLREIENYRASYEKVRAAGKDKSLVFPDWLHPTREDRTLVYDKGAYVMHLLREEMGEHAFWNGLKIYTRRFFGKSVVTSDFKTSMEEANQKSLDKFFAKWVYLSER